MTTDVRICKGDLGKLIANRQSSQIKEVIYTVCESKF